MYGKVLIFLSLVGTSLSQVPIPGPCPAPPVVQDFDVAAYLGTWHQVARFPNFNEFGNCSVAKYGPVGQDGLVAVNNSEIVNGAETYILGTVELADPNSTEAKLIVTFNVQGQTTKANYWVLSTDYVNYTLVWSCEYVSGNNLQFAWILAREKPLSFASTSQIFKVLNDLNIDASQFEVHELPSCTKAP